MLTRCAQLPHLTIKHRGRYAGGTGRVLQKSDSLKTDHRAIENIRYVPLDVYIRFCRVGSEEHSQILIAGDAKPLDANVGVFLRRHSSRPHPKSFGLVLARIVTLSSVEVIRDAKQSLATHPRVEVEPVDHEVARGWLFTYGGSQITAESNFRTLGHESAYARDDSGLVAIAEGQNAIDDANGRISIFEVSLWMLAAMQVTAQCFAEDLGFCFWHWLHRIPVGAVADENASE